MDLPTSLSLLLALAPAVVAIALALTTRKVVPALFLGVVAGAVIATLTPIYDAEWWPTVWTLLSTLIDAVIPGLADALSGEGSWDDLDTSHLVITAFSLMVAAMVGVLGRSGATRALVRLMEGAAKGPRGAMVAAWLSGCLVFFDDYANCLVVGSAMGPLFDRFKVSRAKLAYIVDSTAAPVASLALVSTWIGYEVGLIGDELLKAGSEASALTIFLEALPYRFYGFVTLAMVGAVALSGRDFGPMLKAERAARAGQAPVEPADSAPGHLAWGAVVPVVSLIVVTFIYLIVDGVRANLDEVGLYGGFQNTAFFDIVGSADPFWAMFWGSVVAVSLAVTIALLNKSLSGRTVPSALWSGVRPVMDALGVLFLAWALGNAMANTGAADALSEVIAPTNIIAFDGTSSEIAWHAVEPAKQGRVEISTPEGRVVFNRTLDTLRAGPGRLTWDGSGLLHDGAPAGTYVVNVPNVTEDGHSVRVFIRGQERFPSWLLPSIVFLVAAGTAFATGTSYGTMGILIPLAVPLGVWVEAGEPGPILLGSVAAVLAGAILGDHASPISDTTVLSALGAGVELVEHVRTQLPYALTAGVISLVAGYIPAGLGVSPLLLIPAGCAMAFAVVWIFGRPSTAPT
ncbi:MAG: Na+/H+ antiporter NhaC family protein [Myxococcota bacterium]